MCLPSILSSTNIRVHVHIFYPIFLCLFIFFWIALNALFMYKEFLLIVILIFMLIDPIPVTGGASAVGCGK